MSTRKPAAARSSSDSPPQKPYSRCSRAQRRHGSSTGQAMQMARARASRRRRVSGRSPAGAKNNSVCPEHAASAVQVRGPVKSRLETVSTATVSSMWSGSRAGGGRGPGGRMGGGSSPRRALRRPWLPIGFNLSNKQLRWMPSVLQMDKSSRAEPSSRTVKEDDRMELRHLDAVLAVAEEGSFTAAADLLATVQSNVSEQVRQLEAELGAELFVRSRRGARPTDSGEVVLERARRVRRELEAMRADLSMLQGLEVGEASFGVVGTASRWLVPELVADLRTRAPGVHLRVIEAASERLVAEVVS